MVALRWLDTTDAFLLATNSGERFLFETSQLTLIRMKSKRIAQFLTIFAFAIDLILRNMAGVISSVSVAAVALYFFIKSLRVSTRLRKIRLPSENRFISYTCALMFGFANFISKFVIPFYVSTDDAITSVWILLLSGLLTYLVFLVIEIKTGHRDRYSHQPLSRDVGKREDTLLRTENGLVLLSALAGLDGADLMLAIQLIIFFFSEILGLIKIATKNVIVSLELIRKLVAKPNLNLRGIIRHVVLDWKKTKSKDTDKIFWDRAFYLIRYKKGLAFLIFSCTASLPLVFFSWTIDFFNFKPYYLVGLVLLTIPSVTSLALVRIPSKIVSHHREKWRRRILLLCMIPSVLAILMAVRCPNIIPLISRQTNVAWLEQMRLKVGEAALLSLFPVFLGIPIFFGVASSEVDRTSDFVKWFRVAGFMPFFLMICLAVVGYFYSNMNVGDFLFFLYVSYLVGAFFYIFMCYVTFSALHSFHKRYDLNISSLILRLFNAGPNLTTAIPSLALGVGIFVVLEIPPLFLWKTEQILFVSLILTFAYGSLIQYPNSNGIRGSVWISSFAIIAYILASFFFALSISPRYFSQILVTWGYRIIVLPMVTILVGNAVLGFLTQHIRKVRYSMRGIH
jgi:hypothetical protein